MILLSTQTVLFRPPAEVIEAVFDEANWLSFRGHGMVPGIAAVTITPGPDGRVGTRFAVTNTDGSTHGETVLEYEEGKRLVLRMDSFSKPLSRFADHFIETWTIDDVTLHRNFEMVARNRFGRLLLRLVCSSLRRAVENQNREMARA